MGTIKGLGIDYPIGKGNTGFFKQTLDTFTNVKSKINVLLRTMEKERPFNPDFGIGLHRYLFEPLTRELNIILEDKIRDKVAIYIPEVIITDLEINKNFNDNVDNNELIIKISFALKTNPENTLDTTIVVQ